MNLYPFQKQAVSEMLHFLQTNETHSVYNACEQGLGKTFQSLAVTKKLPVSNVLIICPSVMRLVWAEEIKKIYGDALPLISVIMDGKFKFTCSQHVPVTCQHYCICSYDLIIDRTFKSTENGVVVKETKPSKAMDYILTTKWDVLICDEAHKLKSTAAKRSKVVYRKLWPAIKYHIMLSATPFTVSVVDGYAPFHKILPSEFPDFPNFVDRFSYQRVTPFATEYFGLKNPEALRKIIRSNFYVRYTKEQVLPELQPKTYQTIKLPVKYSVMPKGKTEAEQLKLEMERIKLCIETGKQPVIPTNLAEHRRLQGEAKVPAVVEFCENLLEQDIPLVVFAWHKNVIDGISKALGKYNPAIITGATPAGQRMGEIQSFMAGRTNLFLGNLCAAGTGITLTRSSTVVLAELDWSPAVVAQAIDRVHRIGQKDAVNVYTFVAENSLDESIHNVVMSRTKLFKEVLE